MSNGFPDIASVAGAPKYRIFSWGGVTWATVFGSPVAGGIVMAINYWRWNQKRQAWIAVIGGILAFFALIAIANILPESIPAAAILVPQIYVAREIAKHLQGARVEAHLRANGKKASNWIGVGIGVLTLFVLAVAFFTWNGGIPSLSALTDAVHSVDMGHDEEVYYARGATRETAELAGEALKKAGYFDGKHPASVVVAGLGNEKEIGFVVGTGAWDDAEMVKTFTSLAESIVPAIGGKPAILRLLDENLVEKKRIPLN